MGFFGSIFGGSNPVLNGGIGRAGDISQFGTNTGEGDVSAADSFEKAIMSGDPAKIGQVLGPQIRNIVGQGNQRIQTGSQFGTRSGGTNAENQMITDNTRSGINDMVSRLTGGAVSDVGNRGMGLMNMGLSADQLQAMLAQMRMQNQQGSILGGIFGGLGSDLGKIIQSGLGRIPGLQSVFGAPNGGSQ